MSKKIRIENNSKKYNKYYSYCIKDDGFDNDEGYVTTKYGYVIVGTYGSSDTEYYSELRFIYKGIAYTRFFYNKRYTRQGLVIKSRQLAEEVVKGKFKESKS